LAVRRTENQQNGAALLQIVDGFVAEWLSVLAPGVTTTPFYNDSVLQRLGVTSMACRICMDDSVA